MAEKEKKSLSLKEKLMRIQVELKAPKNLYNSFGKYKYRNVEGIQEALKPLEKEFGVLTVLTDEMVEVVGRVYVKATASILDIESDESISVSAYAREAMDKKGMDDAQVTGATSSYARKYALNGLFLLDDTKDVDSEEYQIATKNAPKKPIQVETSEPDYRALLREFLKDMKIDPKSIVKECGLKPDSPNEEWKKALEFAKGIVTEGK